MRDRDQPQQRMRPEENESDRKQRMTHTDPITESRLQQLQSEEMALRNLLDTVSEYTRSDIESLLHMVRQQIDDERSLMQRDDKTDDNPLHK